MELDLSTSLMYYNELNHDFDIVNDQNILEALDYFLFLLSEQRLLVASDILGKIDDCLIDENIFRNADIKTVHMKINSGLLREKCNLLRSRALECRRILDEFDSHDDWTIAQTYKGITTSFRNTDDESLWIKLEGMMENVPLFEQLAVVRETDLYHIWAPFVNKSKLIKELDKVELLTWFNIHVPFLTRDAVIHAYGCDCIYEEDCVLLVGESVDNWPHIELPEKPKGFNSDRLDIKGFRAKVQALSPISARTSIIANIDIKAPLPKSLINFIMKKLAGVLLYYLQLEAAKLSSDPTHPHSIRIMEDTSFYRDWLWPKYERLCLLKKWTVPRINSLGIYEPRPPVNPTSLANDGYFGSKLLYKPHHHDPNDPEYIKKLNKKKSGLQRSLHRSEKYMKRLKKAFLSIRKKKSTKINGHMNGNHEIKDDNEDINIENTDNNINYSDSDSDLSDTDSEDIKERELRKEAIRIRLNLINKIDNNESIDDFKVTKKKRMQLFSRFRRNKKKNLINNNNNAKKYKSYGDISPSKATMYQEAGVGPSLSLKAADLERRKEEKGNELFTKSLKDYLFDSIIWPIMFLIPYWTFLPTLLNQLRSMIGYYGNIIFLLFILYKTFYYYIDFTFDALQSLKDRNLSLLNETKKHTLEIYIKLKYYILFGILSLSFIITLFYYLLSYIISLQDSGLYSFIYNIEYFTLKISYYLTYFIFIIIIIAQISVRYFQGE